MKRIIGVILAAAMALATPAVALADQITGKTWNVTYTSAGKMQDDYSSEEYIEEMSNLQPGDEIKLTIQLHHENAEPADWYLRNDVVRTLEEASGAEGSAYAYTLTYSGPNGRTLFDSSTIGGDEGDGLKDADTALSDEDFIYLDNLSQGQPASVTLVVALDGETEGNDYFRTLAQLKLAFAVEPEPEPENTERVVERRIPRDRVVQTGEENRLFPFYVAMLASGVLFAGLAVVSYRERKKDAEGGAR